METSNLKSDVSVRDSVVGHIRDSVVGHMPRAQSRQAMAWDSFVGHMTLAGCATPHPLSPVIKLVVSQPRKKERKNKLHRLLS